ncbi:hypothetical protein [Cupriavidus sp. UGS-1]|uniref:hypothetical protein n=1 Tax=Cupriavidus sp. UGS-1 TaxID=2899826 RepID=UPI001E33F5DB|nr:hypothetical protein [Cupriavidus sp. UGS-1]MCD9119811.1 hypothetical protein [Cupriavidus sp. UGS-1]
MSVSWVDRVDEGLAAPVPSRWRRVPRGHTARAPSLCAAAPQGLAAFQLCHVAVRVVFEGLRVQCGLTVRMAAAAVPAADLRHVLPVSPTPPTPADPLVNRLPQRLLLSVALAMVALPLPGLAGTAKPTCGTAQATAATPLMSRHAALKLQAEAQLLGREQAGCTGADSERDTGDDAAEGEDRHASHPAAAMCPIAAVLPGRELSQYRHMPPRSPLGTLAGATPDSLLLPAPARC